MVLFAVVLYVVAVSEKRSEAARLGSRLTGSKISAASKTAVSSAALEFTASESVSAVATVSAVVSAAFKISLSALRSLFKNTFIVRVFEIVRF